jgi:hypothetical protein
MQRLFFVLLATACSAGSTQPPVVVSGLSGGTCDEVIPAADPYDAAMAQARCEHPDMLVHPRCYVLVRVPAPGDAHLYALEMSTPVDRCDLGGTTTARIASYCVGKDGKATLVGPTAICR